MTRSRLLVRAALVALTSGLLITALVMAVNRGPKPGRAGHESRVATARMAHSRPAPNHPKPGPPPAQPNPPPAPSAQPATPSRPLAGQTIVIDPGHNGGNGAHSDQINQLVPAGGFTKPCDTAGAETNGGYAEATFSFNVARALAGQLESLGATVVMTRTTNDGVGPCVNQRAAIGNAAHAAAVVSIHADGGPPGGRGFEVIQPGSPPGYPATDAIIAPSHALALAVRDAYRSATGMPFADYVGSAGLDTRTDLAGLNLSTVPKVFIECGNLRNPTDAGLLVTPAFQQRAAQGLAAALVAYLRH